MSIGLPEEASPFQSPVSGGNGAILVVDEDPAFQLGLKTFLREYVGFDEVFVANSGKKALQLIEENPAIEVITLDYQMPEMNGIEVLKELRDTVDRPLSVTMITGYPSEELETEFKSFASPTLLTTHFLSKPVEFEKLEPLMLRAHEDLDAAKIALRPDDDDEIAIDELPSTEDEHILHIEEQLAAHGAQLDRIESQLQGVRKSVRAELWKLILLGAAFWAAFHFGWVAKLTPVWENLKENVSQVVESVAAKQNSEEANAAPSAPDPAVVAPEPGDAAPPAKPSEQEEEPANSGSPL